MKASPLHDAKGLFIGVIGAVRDITEEMGEELLRQLTPTTVEIPVVAIPATPHGSRIDKLLGKAKSSYKEGVRLFYRESKYADAIPHFDRAIEIDPSLAPAWYDRGLCLRELSKDDEALKSFNRALELVPNDEEYLFSRAEMLKKIGILRGQKTAVDAAVRAFHKVIEINPNHVDALNGLAICMKEQGKEDAARQYFDRARDLIRAGTTPKKTRSPDSRV
jgi:Flp pilus assembly protein TadD